jgi:hypothetical protein
MYDKSKSKKPHKQVPWGRADSNGLARRSFLEDRTYLNSQRWTTTIISNNGERYTIYDDGFVNDTVDFFEPVFVDDDLNWTSSSSRANFRMSRNRTSSNNFVQIRTGFDYSGREDVVQYVYDEYGNLLYSTKVDGKQSIFPTGHRLEIISKRQVEVKENKMNHYRRSFHCDCCGKKIKATPWMSKTKIFDVSHVDIERVSDYLFETYNDEDFELDVHGYIYEKIEDIDEIDSDHEFITNHFCDHPQYGWIRGKYPVRKLFSKWDVTLCANCYSDFKIVLDRAKRKSNHTYNKSKDQMIIDRWINQTERSDRFLRNIHDSHEAFSSLPVLNNNIPDIKPKRIAKPHDLPWNYMDTYEEYMFDLIHYNKHRERVSYKNHHVSGGFRALPWQPHGRIRQDFDAWFDQIDWRLMLKKRIGEYDGPLLQELDPSNEFIFFPNDITELEEDDEPNFEANLASFAI